MVSHDNDPGSKLNNGRHGHNDKQQNTRLTGNPKRYVYIFFFIIILLSFLIFICLFTFVLRVLLLLFLFAEQQDWVAQTLLKFKCQLKIN